MSEDLYGRDVICLASLGWDAHFCTPQQIAVRLGRRCKVLYVEPLRSPLHALKRSGTQSRRPARAPYEVAPGVWLLTLPPLFVPMVLYRRVPLLRRLNNGLMSRWVRHAARQAGLHDPVVWAYQITYEGAPLLREAPLAVYDCIDEWAGAARDEGERHYFQQLDGALCRSADVLFVGSQGLARSRQGVNAATALVPQGVDLEVFLPPPGGWPVPADIAAIPGPRIGLVGVLNKERVDVALLCHLADARPQWHIVLVGPVWEGLDTGALDRRPNIHRLGNKPKEQLGAYIGALDVCLLPYLINDFTRNIFPLKLFEYLASGKPFVATPVPACEEFPGLIRVADGHEAFLAAVEAALAEDDAALRAARTALARENDWDRRTADKLAYATEQLRLKEGHA